MAEPEDRGKSDGQDALPTINYGSVVLKAGAQIGPYKLLSVLGEGGCGMVYLAEQRSPVTRRVALKIIKPGMDTKEVIARFEAERQALALLDHPNIASVHDAGATKTGRPYFVMEYVKGVSITEHCDREKLGIEERLSLFLQVCEAVQYAHQKGIIHRDIKPSNIQVSIHGDKAVPKIIDFGLAKALSQLLTERTLVTEQGQIVGTPEYMSPEQAEMANQDIDTRTDIYSLGAVLYKLLTGTLPFDPDTLRGGGADHMRRMIREQDPKTPSTRLSRISVEESARVAQLRRTDHRGLTRRLSGDLDWITMKAMEKNRMRRYQTAQALAEDIQRHLNHQPVLARKPGNIYRLRKFLRRNRTAAAACFAAAILIAAMVGVSLMYLQGLRRTREVQALQHKTILSGAMELRSKGQFQEAIDRIENILASKHVGPDARLLHARLVLELEGPAQAVKELEPLLSERDEIACQAHFLLARIYLESNAADAATAAKYQQKAKEHQDAGEKLFSESAEACFNRSMMAGTVNETLEWLNKALELNPGHYDSLRARALGYYALKDYNRMEIDASMMIGNRPDDSQGYALRAIARREKAIRENDKTLLDEAIKDHDKAIGISPKEAVLYDERRETCMRMGNYQQALRDARQCIDMQPEKGIYRFGAFCALVALGKYDDAKVEYERTFKSGLMSKWQFDNMAKKHVSDMLADGLPWHPSESKPQGVAFLAMHESAETCEQLARKARRVVSEGFHPTWSPDGTELAYSSGIIGFTGIEILTLESGKTRLLTVPGHDPAWSPDGKHIAFIRVRQRLLLSDITAKHDPEDLPYEQREIWLIRADGAEKPRFLAPGGSPSWSNDPERLFYHSPKDMKLYSVSIEKDAEPTPIVSCPGKHPIVSPDGRYVAYTLNNMTSEVYIADLADKSIVARSAAPPMVRFGMVGWSPNGRELAVGGSGGLWIFQLDRTMSLGQASKVFNGSLGWSNWSCPAAGKLAFGRNLGGVHHEIWVAQAGSLGPGQTVEEHLTELRSLYTRRIEADPHDKYNYVLRAAAHVRLDKKQALEDFDNYTKLLKDPSTVAGVYGWLAFTLLLTDPEVAAELYLKAHEIQPGNSSHLSGLGMAHFFAGRAEEAVAELLESTRLPDGENSISYFVLSMAHWQLGDKEEEATWYKKAIEWKQSNSIPEFIRPFQDYLHSEASKLMGIADGAQ